jgi:FHS family L-fucose permease-like MFS transporter
MLVASNYILSELQVEKFRQEEKASDPAYTDMLPSVADGKVTQALQDFAVNNPIDHQAMQAADLITVRGPYVAIAAVVAVLFLVFLFSKLPRTISSDKPFTMSELSETFKRLLNNLQYIEGVIAQAFYVGAQIMCWTFVIHYGISVVGLSAAEAQSYNIIAMSIFLCSRFICTFLLGFVKPGQLMMILSVGGIALMLGTIFIGGITGLYCLIATSACMSLMFPTIYGIALKNMGDDASLASAGLVMAIVGGAFMPPLQGAMIDAGSIIGDIPSVQTSFLLPLLCFVVICIFGYRAYKVHNN